jgi:predicted phosphoribosyltransferase
MIIYADSAIDLEESTNSPLDLIRPFSNLRAGGRELATKLEQYRDREDVVVLALVMGGVLVGHEVAQEIGAPFDFVIIRHLLAPEGPGSLVCAVNVAGSLIVDEELLPKSAPATPLEYFLTEALARLAQREQTCRAGRPPLDLKGKTIILVDCGIRSATTMRAAIGPLRTKQPAKIIAAVPLASCGGSATVASLADELVCLGTPRPFGHVGVWYTDFSRPGDDEVAELL